MARFEHICTDPSHPPVIGSPGPYTQYEQVSAAVGSNEEDGLSSEENVRLVSGWLIPQMASPSSFGAEGYRLQQMRQQIAGDWKEVFNTLDNLCHLTGWFINDCDRDVDAGELHFVLCLLAFEAIRNVFATVNQLRSGLSSDTFGYLRTLYETLVKSRFLKEYADSEPDLPGKLAYYTNTTYLDFYCRFAPVEDETALNNMWVEAERYYDARFQKDGRGDYGWAYPLVKSKNGQPKLRPTFRDLMDIVDKDSAFSEIYYDVSTSKTHGEFLWSPLMVRAEGRGTHVDSFNVGDIGLVLDLMLPLFEEILENTGPSCTVGRHGVVMSIIRVIFKDIRESVAAVKESNPEMHRGVDSPSKNSEA